MNTLHLGRNISEDNGRFYLTLNWERDLTSSHDKSYIKSGFDTYRKARLALTKYKKGGAHWFDAHFDPTI